MAHPGALGFLFAGLIVWAARFLAIYIFTALACAKGFADATVAAIGIVPAFVGAATVLALAANAWVMMYGIAQSRRGPDENEPSRFIGATTAAVAGLSILAILWEALPVLIIPVCA